METNDAGQVAIKTKRPPRMVEGKYVFVSRANITMAWIDPEDVPKILAIKGGCCGKRNKPIFFQANESDVRRWINGGGR